MLFSFIYAPGTFRTPDGAKAFLTPKVPYRPRMRINKGLFSGAFIYVCTEPLMRCGPYRALLELKMLWPHAIVGKISRTNVLSPPRVFGGADRMGPKRF